MPYAGPGNPAVRPNQYVFLVLRQNTRNLVLDETWIEIIGAAYELQFRFGEFVTAHDMEGWYLVLDLMTSVTPCILHPSYYYAVFRKF